ncbi:hypothetical protein [Maribacter sp. ACAM166]|uniref:hypothetical protein n=1 Tax=Maribacter sp. ACAM166 TaxID=2508996 RepID=UPI0010FF3D3E|nr:hypothetical protein [Maribacter sp. ACAM166]TLP81360.1 hypothetical protein ES765_04960 [Maribacter sp. ACAM166]
MNFKNAAENLLIALIGVVFGCILTFFIITQSNKALSKQLTPIIEQAIAKETTAITNEFITEIKKLKSRGGSTVELNITPDIKNKAQTITTKDSLPEKKGFFKRLFGKKDKNK